MKLLDTSVLVDIDQSIDRRVEKLDDKGQYAISIAVVPE